ncbi:MAG: hypothetical protein HY717_13385 [Planctomycetes bacterium]|nr:hypothetical protein [Planctomycetota bacterium]
MAARPRRFLLILGSALLALLAAAGLLVLCRRFSAPGTPASPLALQGFQRVESWSTRDSVVEHFANGERHLKIEHLPVDAESAKTLIEEEVFAMEALHANALSPYPGDLSKEIAFPEKFKPRFRESDRGGIHRAWFLLHASARFGLGVSAADVVKYKALVGFFYSPEEGLFFTVKYFAPPAEADEEMEKVFFSLR